MQERELVLKSYEDIAAGKGRDSNEFFDELELRYAEVIEELSRRDDLQSNQ